MKDALDAFIACAELGLDIQLKILQALPSLLQNYAAELEGELLSSALQVCSSLQGAKAPTVNGVAAATLQQLVSTVFEKVASEDAESAHAGTEKEPSGSESSHELKTAAYDAYRVFLDLALAAEERKTKFVQLPSLSAESSLELIWSCMHSNPDLFKSHNELLDIIGSNVFPLVIRALSERLPFSMTVRSLRILDLLLESYLTKFFADCEVAIGLCNHVLEPESSPLWKRALVMEVLRNFFVNNGQVVEGYSVFDGREGGKPVIQDLTASFVRLATERPAAIGLGQQSNVPTGNNQQRDNDADQSAFEAAGGISFALSVTEVNIPGISAQWSLPKSSCLEQLDKNDPPIIPETYLYAMVLDCLTGLSDGLARIVLPLVVNPEKSRSKTSTSRRVTDDDDPERTGSRSARSNSTASRAFPVNPLDATSAPYASRVKSVARIVESCWPAFLATSSTFLNAALDDQYFRSLIKAHQRLAQVAGLLCLVTPRDALMTALAKASVPPHVFGAAVNEQAKTPFTESPRVFSNPKALLSIDSLVSQSSSLPFDRDRRSSIDPPRPMLTIRNLLCLRALLNLAIALGPTLESAFAVVANALRQADLILSMTSPQQITRQSSSLSQKGSESPSAVQMFSAEVAAVEAAASRLLESTADYPNPAFVNVLQIFCRLLHNRAEDAPTPTTADRPSSPLRTPSASGRTFSSTFGFEVQARDYQFVIPKLGNLAELNISRFASKGPESNGWNTIVDELLAIAPSNTAQRDARRTATNVLVKMAGDTVAQVMKESPEMRMIVQRRALVILLRLVDGIYLEEGELTSTDLEVQNHVLDALRAILERCGESLVAGWNRMVAIISCAFHHEGTTVRGSDEEEVYIDWKQVSTEFVSPQIGRVAFAATQLLCSDFMDSLPTSVVPSLIELLHRFTSQVEDLNIALTTVSMAWNVSDFLFYNFKENDLVSLVTELQESEDIDQNILSAARNSRPAQWLLILIRLRNMANQPLKEVRNAVYQTACNVFKSHGNQLPPSAWDLLLRSTIFRIASNDSNLYRMEEQSEDSDKPNIAQSNIEMSTVIIAGNADVISEHLHIIQQVARLPSLWEVFLGILEKYLDIENLDLDAAAFSALAKVVSHIDPSSAAWKGPIYRTVALWLKRFPDGTNDETNQKSNQTAFLAYAEAGEELYPLIKDTMSISQNRTMIDNLYHCIRDSDGPSYGGDVSNMSPLQSRVLKLLKNIRTDQPNIPTTLLTVAAKLASLHHEMTDGISKGNQPLFVAVASESVDWLQGLISANIDNPELMDSDSIILAISTLRKIVEENYGFRLKYKGVPLWRRATSTALALAQPLLERAESANIDTNIRTGLWSEYVAIAGAIVQAKGMHLVNDRAEIREDQSFDIAGFKSLRNVLIPRLGSSDLAPELRVAYARSLFDASIVHPTEDDEIPSAEYSPLESIETIRRGRVKRVPFSLREDIAYTCFKELIALSTKTDGSSEHQRLAQAAAPYLLLRLAIPIRAYIADQPLRGRRPQPLSELEELLFCFDGIQDLELDPQALAADAVAAGRGNEHAHLYFLFPLLIEAVSAAGDSWSGSDEVLIPLQKVLAAVNRRV